MPYTINPATGEKLKDYPYLELSNLESAIENTHQAYIQWRDVSFSERAKAMLEATGVLKASKSKYAAIMAEEMGKPIADGEAEAEKCAWVCEYYAQNAEDFLKPEEINSDAARSAVHFLPLGVVFAIMPWNFPFWQVFRFAAPSLMAGNAALLKHSPNVFGCALAIEEVFRQAGFPEHLFTNLIIDTDAAAQVIEHPKVKAVTLTGSTRAGKSVAGKAGSVLKKTVLELGGSDPYVVLEDADLEKTVKTCTTSRLINNGQSCISAKRFIVPSSLKTSFENMLVEQMKSYKTGDPFDPETKLGPMAREDLRDNLHSQVKKSIEKGAKCLLGAEMPEGPGFFYPPTVLTDVAPGMPAYDEEVFGPVAAIIEAKDETDALKIANDSQYGLGAAIFSQDTARAEKIAAENLDAGCCFINDFVKSDPRLPFGGIKESGYGRELSHFGIREFVNIKTVYVG